MNLGVLIAELSSEDFKDISWESVYSMHKTAQREVNSFGWHRESFYKMPLRAEDGCFFVRWTFTAGLKKEFLDAASFGRFVDAKYIDGTSGYFRSGEPIWSKYERLCRQAPSGSKLFPCLVALGEQHDVCLVHTEFEVLPSTSSSSFEIPESGDRETISEGCDTDECSMIIRETEIGEPGFIGSVSDEISPATPASSIGWIVNNAHIRADDGIIRDGDDRSHSRENGNDPILPSQLFPHDIASMISGECIYPESSKRPLTEDADEDGSDDSSGYVLRSLD